MQAWYRLLAQNTHLPFLSLAVYPPTQILLHSTDIGIHQMHHHPVQFLLHNGGTG